MTGSPAGARPARAPQDRSAGTGLCILLACFAGPRQAASIRRKPDKRIGQSGDAILDQVVVTINAKRRALVYDLHVPHVQPLQGQVADHRVDVHPDMGLVAADGGRTVGPPLPGQPRVKPAGDSHARLGRIQAEAQASAHVLDRGKLPSACGGVEDEIADALLGSPISSGQPDQVPYLGGRLVRLGLGGEPEPAKLPDAAGSGDSGAVAHRPVMAPAQLRAGASELLPVRVFAVAPLRRRPLTAHRRRFPPCRS